MAKIFFTYRIPGPYTELLKHAGHEVVVKPGKNLITADELRQALQTYDAIVCLLTDKIDADLLAAAGSQLKIIANYAVGFDNINVAAAKEKGIMVTNTPGPFSEAVSEHAMLLVASIARRLVEADAFTRAGHYQGWRPELMLGAELQNKNLAIIGVGYIGKGLAIRAKKGFGMHIMYHDLQPFPELEQELSAVYYQTIDDMIPSADFISLHMPLVPETHHLMNAHRLSLMKKTAFLINTARGAIIDEAALVTALKEKRIAGAALDVFEQEPALSDGLVSLPNVILTPHIGSATHETREAMAELAIKNVLAVLANQPPLTPVP
jgi:glyoxylate reductase